MNVVFLRVDGRMIHGQVATAWTRLLLIDSILVVNDEIAEDEMQKVLLELAVPGGVDLYVASIDEAYRLLADQKLMGTKSMVVFRKLQDAVRLYDKGYKFTSLNIGGIYFESGKTQYAKALCLNDRDIQDIKYILDRGVDVFYQVAPMNEREDIKKYIK